jgi:hypothetical protein
MQPIKKETTMASHIAVAPEEFIVPRTFAEFSDRYPTYIRDWVRRRHFGLKTEQEIDAAVSDLTVHMLTFPEGSIFRERGFIDRIEAFDHELTYGCGYDTVSTEQRFHRYVKRCLNSYYVTLDHRSRAA